MTDEPTAEPTAEPLGEPLGEPLEGLEPEPVPHRNRRWYPGSIGGFLYLGVLAATAVGIYLVAAGDDWRLGVRWEAGALIGAAVLRLVIPRREAGMLAVRHRLVDVVVLGACGGVLLFLAATIPNQPPL